MKSYKVVRYNVPVIDLRSTGQKIERLRKSLGLSVKDLQIIMGFTNPQTIYKWQNGVCLPTVDNLLILSGIFGVTVNELLVCYNGGELNGIKDT